MCLLICLKSVEKKEDRDQYNNLYVGGPWVAYTSAHGISQGGTSSTIAKLKSHKIAQKPPPPPPVFPYNNDATNQQGLIHEYNNSQMLGGNELVDLVFVKRVVNNLSFQFELKQPCTHIFKLEETTFFHACLTYPKSADC